MTLKSAQAGLSLDTILKRRSAYREAFSNFYVNKIVLYNKQSIETLLINLGIIRHKGKIKATINNAKCFIEVQKEFGSFSHYLWAFVDNKTIVNQSRTSVNSPTNTLESIPLSNNLKKRGFTFVVPTICYAFMQACGMVNDHSMACYKKSQIIEEFKQ